jgi:hypothetical protein
MNLTRRICELSRVMHDCLFSDTSQSLCSRAWQRRNVSRFWAAWVRIFGQAHCARSYRHYHGESE